ncbi:MAG: T9SS type A sorting domain-containing protein [Chitinophagales bacterium]|nr:T9SS type A sorting domain-containing protein [Chitinophagales bacterium]
MKILLAIAVLSMFFQFHTEAQSSAQTKDFTFEKKAEIKISSIKKDWAPKLISLEAPFPGTQSFKHFLELIKKDIKPIKGYSNTTPSAAKTAAAPLPQVMSSFMGNDYDFSVPCDNDVAVSNNRKVISVVNSTIYMFDAENDVDTLMFDLSLDAFADTLNLTGGANNKYDPKVAYDPNEDKFILVCLNSSQDSNKTKIIVGFSQTNDPTGDWNLYTVDGNPLSTYTWSDYPMIAITDDEFFITINSIGVNEPWETGFKQTFIWQIDKYSGYNGNALDSRLYFDIKFGNKPIRNLCPIPGGSDLAGPNLYLLSNRNFAVTNDTIFVLEVTGLKDDPTTQLNIDFLLSPTDYGAPPNGWQIDGNFDLFLSTNDARILGGYLEGDQLHFVGNTAVYTDTVRAGVFHGRINNISNISEAVIIPGIITDDILDFGYPNISYTGSASGDNQAIISYNHVADSIWAGFSATSWNQHQGYSDRVELKAGESFVSILGSQFQRWGDYSGSQPLYNEPGVVWVSGFYGGTSLANDPFVNLTWVAELKSDYDPQTGIELPATETSEATVYPNPGRERFIVEFVNDEKRWMTFSIYTVDGKMLRLLMEEIVKEGENIFSFNVNALDPGTYFLQASDGNTLVFSEKVVVQ